MTDQSWERLYIPRLEVDLRNFRKHPVGWYQTWNVEEGQGHGLYDKAQELKRACGYRWANSIMRLHHMAGGNTFTFAINKQHNKRKNRDEYSFMVWDDVRGLVVNKVFVPDEEDKIPESVIREIHNELSRWTKGFTTCRNPECDVEFKWLDGHGRYYDSLYCSEECAAKFAQAEAQRSR